MSTKSTVYLSEHDSGLEHNLGINIFRDMHESDNVLVVELTCSTCYCSYQFLMTKHLGLQLAEQLRRGEVNK